MKGVDGSSVRTVVESGLGVTEAPGASGLRRAVAVSSAGKVLEFVTLGALATVVPRALGPTAYGRFALVLTLITVLTLALTLGGPALVTRYVPTAEPARQPALARALVGHLARGRVKALLAAVALSALAILAFPGRVPALETTVVLAGVALGVGSTLLLLVGLGLGQAGAWAIQYPLQNTALVLLAVGLHRVWGVEGAMVAVPLAAIPTVVMGLMVARTALSDAGPPETLPAGAERFAALQAVAAALVQFIHRGGVLAVAALGTGPGETGFAALAVGIGLGATAAVLQTFTVAVPHLDGSTGEAPLQRLALAMVPVLALGGLIGVTLVDRLVPIVFGEAYRGASDVFIPAIAAVILAPLGSLAVQAAVLRHRPDVAVQAAAAGVVAFVITALVAVEWWAAAGGTAATLVGLAVAGLVSMVRLPGAISGRLALASYGAAGLVVAVGMSV